MAPYFLLFYFIRTTNRLRPLLDRNGKKCVGGMVWAHAGALAGEEKLLFIFRIRWKLIISIEGRNVSICSYVFFFSLGCWNWDFAWSPRKEKNLRNFFRNFEPKHLIRGCWWKSRKIGKLQRGGTVPLGHPYTL